MTPVSQLEFLVQNRNLCECQRLCLASLVVWWAAWYQCESCDTYLLSSTIRH